MTERMRFYCTEAEAEQIKAAAEKASLCTSTFMRLAVIAAVREIMKDRDQSSRLGGFFKGANDDRPARPSRSRHQPDRQVTFSDPPQAWLDVMAERHRQVTGEGFTAQHDDAQHPADLAVVAACYAMGAVEPLLDSAERNNVHRTTGALWPWSVSWLKPTTPRRDLVKAGALILAAIEQIDRKEGVK